MSGLHLVSNTGAMLNVAAQVPHPELTGRAARYLTRQPLLSSEFHVLGYELRVREHVPLPMPEGATHRDQARDEFLLRSVAEARYQELMSRRFTLLEVEPRSLSHPLLEKLNKENVILALDAPMATPELLERGQSLARDGYALALDVHMLTPALEPLLGACRYLRLDVASQGIDAIREQLARIGRWSALRLIARNIETEEAYLACRKLNFEIYQGYYFAQTNAGKPRLIDTRRPRVLNLVNLAANQAEPAAIEAEFKLDPGLAYKLLRFINSPAVGLRYPVRSIGHALLMLGSEPLYRWLLLLLFVHQDGDGRQRALLRHALVRARLMESLGEATLQTSRQGGLFVVGILSLLDALMQCSRAEALAPLKLAPDIMDALLSGVGPYVPYLYLAEACENSDAENLEACALALGLSPESVNEAHIASLMWAEGIDI